MLVEDGFLGLEKKVGTGPACGNPQSCGLNTLEHTRLEKVMIEQMCLLPYLTAINEANKVLMSVPRAGKKKDKLTIAMYASPLREVFPMKTTSAFIPKFTIVLQAINKSS